MNALMRSLSLALMAVSGSATAANSTIPVDKQENLAEMTMTAEAIRVAANR